MSQVADELLRCRGAQLSHLQTLGMAPQGQMSLCCTFVLGQQRTQEADRILVMESSFLSVTSTAQPECRGSRTERVASSKVPQRCCTLGPLPPALKMNGCPSQGQQVLLQACCQEGQGVT